MTAMTLTRHGPSAGRALRRAAVWLAAGVMLVSASYVRAVSVPDLYSVEVALPERDDAIDEVEWRREAYSRALARVLVRVTGQRGVGSLPEAVPLLDAAEQYIQQFTTRQGEAGSERLWVAFDGAAVEQAAASLGLPIWNRDRPATLIWLVVDRGGGTRDLVGVDSGDPARQAIEAVARERGVPLVWPLLDSTDRASASVADIWGGFGDKVAAASSRYRADVVVVARLSSRGGQTAFGNWEVRTGTESDRFRAGASRGVHQLADYLVSRLAASSDVATVTSITVSNVYSVDAYSDVINYLERLTLIDSIRLRAVQDDVLVFDVDVRGDSARLRRAIDVGRLLVSDTVDGIGLSFRYAR